MCSLYTIFQAYIHTYIYIDSVFWHQQLQICIIVLFLFKTLTINLLKLLLAPYVAVIDKCQLKYRETHLTATGKAI